MNYLLRNKPKSQYRAKTVTVLVIFFIFSTLAFLFPSALRNTTHYLARPLWSLSDTVSSPFRTIKDFFVFKNNLIQRNLSLENKLAESKLKEADYDLIVQENKDLKEQLDFKNESERILSRVLSKPPRTPYDTIVVDVGSNQGITPGNKVYIGGGVIIGLITSVTPKTSLVSLFSTGNQKQDTVLDRTGASFEIKGSGSGNFVLEAPKDTDILWGDTFTYPGSSAVIGNVYYIDTSSQSSFKTVHIRIPENIFSTKLLYIEKDKQD